MSPIRDTCREFMNPLGCFAAIKHFKLKYWSISADKTDAIQVFPIEIDLARIVLLSCRHQRL